MTFQGARIPLGFVAVISCVFLTMSSSAFGQKQPRKRTIVDFNLDRPPEASNRIGKNWRAGGQVELDLIADRDLELSQEFEEDTAVIEPRVDLALAYKPSPRVSAFAQLELSRQFTIEEEDESLEILDPDRAELAVEQAYVTFSEILPGFSMQIGRQLFEDERDWWYREELDAVRLFYGYEKFGLEFSASRSELVGDDLLNRDEPEETNNFFLIGRYAYREEAEFDAYVFKQDDRAEYSEEDRLFGDGEEDPLFLGVRSIGEFGADFEHWIDTAIVRGNDGGEDIRAYGFDAGLIYEPDLKYEPSFTLGLAFGSGDEDSDDEFTGGDEDPDDGINREFRQTGFQESFYYYGEVLAPELSNLWILTGGANAYLTYDFSAGLLYHYYRQHRASIDLRDAFVFGELDGENKELGHALDVVFSYYGSKGLTEGLYADLIVGSFFPGDAYPEDSTNAYFGEFIIGYEF